MATCCPASGSGSSPRRGRVAPEIVVVDTARRSDRPAETWEERVLGDGSRHQVYKRYFTAAELGGELGGGEVLFDGRWFVIVAG